MSEVTLIQGDCLDVLPTLPAGSVDAPVVVAVVIVAALMAACAPCVLLAALGEE